MSSGNNYLTLNSQNYDVVQDINQLSIAGYNNNIRIKCHINNLSIFGNNNKIDGLNPKCLIDSLNIVGNSNTLNLNENCAKMNKNISGNENPIIFYDFSGNRININNNTNNNNIDNNAQFNKAIKDFKNVCERYNIDKKIVDGFVNACNDLNNVLQQPKHININIHQNTNLNQNVNVNFVVNQNVNQISNQNSNNINYSNPSVNQNSNRYVIHVIPVQHQNINYRINNSNQNNNSNVSQNSVYNNSNVLFSTKNLSDFDKKKDDLFLEMDQYQYKHIQKYDSRRETECAICLGEFKRNDIIKEFYKCKHIFHKDCLKSWLKRSNCCPLCNHDLTEDINKIL